eukprot:1151493-Pelagomonas_calceolata.AAC.9
MNNDTHIHTLLGPAGFQHPQRAFRHPSQVASVWANMYSYTICDLPILHLSPDGLCHPLLQGSVRLRALNLLAKYHAHLSCVSAMWLDALSLLAVYLMQQQLFHWPVASMSSPRLVPADVNYIVLRTMPVPADVNCIVPRTMPVARRRKMHCSTPCLSPATQHALVSSIWQWSELAAIEMAELGCSMACSTYRASNC